MKAFTVFAPTVFGLIGLVVGVYIGSKVNDCHFVKGDFYIQGYHW